MNAHGVPLVVHEEVRTALKEGAPVVALESTLLAHGLPKGQGFSVSQTLESVVRASGAIPATIAIADGRCLVGLDGAGLESFLSRDVGKASTRDVCLALARGGAYATTVASTMLVASLAGIRVFASGGIGGVHRDASQTFDESPDLLALARYPVAVVCAGAKAILDLPKTVQRLETLGVPVIGYHTSEFPAFYHGRSGLPVDAQVRAPSEIAPILHARWRLLGQGGLLVVRPPPANDCLPAEAVETQIQAALKKAVSSEVVGPKLTPFLLSELSRASDIDSVRTNIALVKANAELAAGLASAWASFTSNAAGSLDVHP